MELLDIGTYANYAQNGIVLFQCKIVTRRQHNYRNAGDYTVEITRVYKNTILMYSAPVGSIVTAWGDFITPVSPLELLAEAAE